MGNEYVIKDLGNRGISTLKIGYQLLPELFYLSFEQRDRVFNRRIDSKETIVDLKNKLSEIMEFINTEPIPSTDTENEIEIVW